MLARLFAALAAALHARPTAMRAELASASAKCFGGPAVAWCEGGPLAQGAVES